MAAEAPPPITDPRQASPDTYDVVKTYNTIGEKYGVAFENVPTQMNTLAWVVKELKAQGIPNASVLDVGSGTGKPVAALLTEAGHSVTGIDVSPRMVQVSKAAVPSAHFEVADVRTYQPHHQYDVVVACFSLIAGVTRADIRGFFANAFAWLKPGGIFIWGTVPVDGENTHIRWMGMDVVVSSLADEDCFNSIKDAGFEIINVERGFFTPAAVRAGICKEEDIWEEPHLFVWAKKPA